MFKKLLLALTLFFYVSPVAIRAEDLQVPILKEDRVLNVNDKRCVWCSIEVLARRAKDKRLYGLSQDYEGPANEGNVRWVFNDRGISYKMNPQGNTSIYAIYDFLVIPCQYEKRGVAVGIDGRHMVNVVHYDIKERVVKVLDNSDKKLRIRTLNWEWFHEHWDGSAIIIYAKNDRFPRYYMDWNSP